MGRKAAISHKERKRNEWLMAETYHTQMDTKRTIPWQHLLFKDLLPMEYVMFAPRLTRLFGALLVAIPLAAAAAPPVVEVYKSPTCGCCEEWVKHLRANGFTVNAHDVSNPSDYRAKFGIPDQLGSCHSAKVQGYALEGHVPAADIKHLLATKPKARGLAVPGMPSGSPGMEAPRHDAYDVVLVQDDGKASVYKHYTK
jgi:hypothetical protein